MSNYGSALQFAPEPTKNNETIAMAALNQFGLALRQASDDMKNNGAIVTEAVTREVEEHAVKMSAMQERCEEEEGLWREEFCMR